MSDEIFSQDDIDRVLAEAGDAVDKLDEQTGGTADTAAPQAGAPVQNMSDPAEPQQVNSGNVTSSEQVADRIRSMDMPDLEKPASQEVGKHSLDLLDDVNLNVKIELGRTRMLIEDVLNLASGSVVELEKLAGDPVDVYVNERLVAKGEVLVLNDCFCVRVNHIVAEPLKQSQ